jgi:hypothetical protein
MTHPSVYAERLARCLALMVLAAVTTTNGKAVAQAAPWRVVEELRIGGTAAAEAPYLFQGARNVIPDARGRFWVLDSRAFQMRLFDANGVYMRTVGGSGQRSGEFASNPCAFAGPNGEIWVEDGLRRWQRFDDEGLLVGTLTVTSNIGCGIRRWLPDGRFLVVNVDDPYDGTSSFVVYRNSPEGELLPGEGFVAPALAPQATVTWSSERGGQFRGQLPFSPPSTAQLGSTGDFWISDGDGRYAIRRQTPAGDTVLVIERAYEPVLILDSLRARAATVPPQAQAGYIRPEEGLADRIPRFYPPFDSFHFATDGSLWVRRHLANGAQGFDVFSSDGAFLGHVTAPQGFANVRIHAITSDKIYGTVGPEVGPHTMVVRFAIRRPMG